MIRFTTLLTVTLLNIHCIYAQEVVASQGKTLTGTNGSLEYTVGEVIINTISNGNNYLTQGFHQTRWAIETIDSIPDIFVTIYPNPATEVINIETSLYLNTTFTLYDAKGRIVIEEELTSITTSVNVSHLSNGGYFLVFRNEELKLSVKTHKIIKTL